MGKFMLKLPSMGESVTEATLTAWLKEVGDTIAIDDSVVEVSTDKVDSDVPSDVEGTLLEKRVEVNQIVQVGEVIAVIETNQVVEEESPVAIHPIEEDLPPQEDQREELSPEILETVAAPVQQAVETVLATNDTNETSDRFYSPLVKNIAKTEGIPLAELENIPGSGENNRLTKSDLLAYVAARKAAPKAPVFEKAPAASQEVLIKKPQQVSSNSEDQVIEMSRMAKLISHHMTESKNTSVHVQSFVEADVTALWEWREKVKQSFQDREGEKLTFTPIFIAAIIHALKEYPLLNSSVQGDQILQKKDINIGMATALGDGNLIVPVIKNADHLNLVGLAKSVNDLSKRARENQLLPDEVQGGTYTVTNIGNFGSITGTPIINQPQVGIIALGVIRKMPAVIETAKGDYVGIRRKMIISHSYDHRIINGAMGGQFAKTVADYLENWDTTLTF
ncbi:MAG: dihydrolipoamide acetyltransferase family protein [Flavobacteriaceae bacterium]